MSGSLSGSMNGRSFIAQPSMPAVCFAFLCPAVGSAPSSHPRFLSPSCVEWMQRCVALLLPSRQEPGWIRAHFRLLVHCGQQCCFDSACSCCCHNIFSPSERARRSVAAEAAASAEEAQMGGTGGVSLEDRLRGLFCVVVSKVAMGAIDAFNRWAFHV
jgi:hypothetical protein